MVIYHSLSNLYQNYKFKIIIILTILLIKWSSKKYWEKDKKEIIPQLLRTSSSSRWPLPTTSVLKPVYWTIQVSNHHLQETSSLQSIELFAIISSLHPRRLHPILKLHQVSIHQLEGTMKNHSVWQPRNSLHMERIDRETTFKITYRKCT